MGQYKPKPKRTNYLANKNLLGLIHETKMTYCEFTKPEYKDYDCIVRNFDEITVPFLNDTLDQIKKKDPSNTKTIHDLVIRVMTMNHLPPLPFDAKLKAGKNAKAGKDRTPFPPFQHVLYHGQNGYEVVGWSHWKNGQFAPDKGRITKGLAEAYMLLVERIGRDGRFRNYTFIEDMKADAIVQLCEQGLNFDESKITQSGQLNPFAYWTTIVWNAFRRRLNSEKKIRDLRDDLLEASGQAPSSTRQMENEKKEIIK